ncbi:MAG: hypothetical protein P8L16_06440 [Ilumatobacter sp.]|nr:hypothetical protein [Ilumatobacter sp.]
MRAVDVEHIASHQAAAAVEAVRARVEPVPLIGTARPVEPDGVVKARTLKLRAIAVVVVEVAVVVVF